MKILSWNIENFTLTRVLDVTTPATRARAREHLDYITTTVGQIDPDIFVILEPRCNEGPEVGVLATGGGVEGLKKVLGGLKRLSKEWWLVPPLRVNPQAFDGGLALTTRSETVGVFWRDDRLNLIGPWVWPAGRAATGPPVAPGTDMASAYPDGIDGVLVPKGTTAAPRFEWREWGTAKPIYFTEPHDRRPLQVTFTERGANPRTINVLAVHPSPRRAVQALKPLKTVICGDAWPAKGAMTVVAGDVNVNLLNDRPDRRKALAEIEEQGQYTRVAPHPLVGTMLLESKRAVPAGYIGNKCVDYGWVHYGWGTATPAGGPAAMAVDRVKGVAAAPPLPQVTSSMYRPLALLSAIAVENRRNDQFRMSWNYGHIGPPSDGTSDHQPVLLYV